MPKTKADIVAQALRTIRVISDDDDPTPDMNAYAGAIYDGAYSELQATQGLTFTWAATAVPDALFVPLANMVAADVAPHYNKQPPNRARAIGMIRAYLLPDDRADARDLDNDGTVTDAEAEAAGRAEYY